MAQQVSANKCCRKYQLLFEKLISPAAAAQLVDYYMMATIVDYKLDLDLTKLLASSSC